MENNLLRNQNNTQQKQIENETQVEAILKKNEEIIFYESINQNQNQNTMNNSKFEFNNEIEEEEIFDINSIIDTNENQYYNNVIETPAGSSSPFTPKEKELSLIYQIEKCENLNLIREKKQHFDLIIKKEIEYGIVNFRKVNANSNNYNNHNCNNNCNKKEFEKTKIEISYSTEFSINSNNTSFKFFQKNLVNLSEPIIKNKKIFDNNNNNINNYDTLINQKNYFDFCDSTEKSYCENTGTSIINNNDKAYNNTKSKAKSTYKIRDLSNCLDKFFERNHQQWSSDKKVQNCFSHIKNKLNSNNDNNNINGTECNLLFNSPKNQSKSTEHKKFLNEESIQNPKSPNKSLINNSNYKIQNKHENDNKGKIFCKKKNYSSRNFHNNTKNKKLNISPKIIKKDCGKNTLNLFNSDNSQDKKKDLNYSSIKELASESEYKSKNSFLTNKPQNSPINKRFKKKITEFCDTREGIRITEAEKLDRILKLSDKNNNSKTNSTNNLINLSIIEKLKKEDSEIKIAENTYQNFLEEFMTIDNIIQKTIQVINNLVLPKIRKSFEDRINSRKLVEIQDNGKKILNDFRSLEKKNKIFNSITNKEEDHLLNAFNRNLGSKKIWNNPLIKEIMAYLSYRTEHEDDFYTSEEEDEKNDKKVVNVEVITEENSDIDHDSQSEDLKSDIKSDLFVKRIKEKNVRFKKNNDSLEYSSSCLNGKSIANSNDNDDNSNCSLGRIFRKIGLKTNKVIKKIEEPEETEQEDFEIKLNNKKRKRSVAKENSTVAIDINNSSLSIYSKEKENFFADSKKKLIKSSLKIHKKESCLDTDLKIRDTNRKLKFNSCQSLKLIEDEISQTDKDGLSLGFDYKQNNFISNKNYSSDFENNYNEEFLTLSNANNKNKKLKLKKASYSLSNSNSENEAEQEESAEEKEENESSSEVLSLRSLVTNKPKRKKQIFSQFSKPNQKLISNKNLITQANPIFSISKCQNKSSLSSNNLPDLLNMSQKFLEKTTNEKHPNSKLTLTIVCYSDGKIKYIGEASSTRKFHGRGILFYQTGKIKYKGYFKENKYEGYGVYYFKDGNVSHFGEFKKDYTTGTAIQFNQNGSLAYIGQFAKDRFCGFGVLYPLNNLTFEGSFKESKMHGFVTVYHANGNLFFQGNYKNGLQQGTGIIIFPNFYYVGRFEKNDYEKYGVYYYKEKKLWFYGNMKNGAANGFGVEFYDSGNMKQIGFYKNDLMDGIGIKFYDNKSVKSIGEYRKGKDFKVEDSERDKRKAFNYVKKKYDWDFEQMQEELKIKVEKYMSINKKYL